MSQLKKNVEPTSIQGKLTLAIIQAQNIPSLKEPLQPVVSLLKDPSKTHIPANDYSNVLRFLELFFTTHKRAIHENPENAQHVEDLTQLKHDLQQQLKVNEVSNPLQQSRS